MNLNQEQLNIFKTVMEHGSFSAAARHLGKVPSTVSMAIQNLEIDLNLQLFERIGREPVATAAAHTLYEKTLSLLIEMKQWQQHAFALSQGLESELNIVVVSELQHSHWIEYIDLIAQQFPQLQINILNAPQEDALKMLKTQQAQLAFTFEREHLQSGEQFIEVSQESLIPVAQMSSPLAQLEQISFAQIQQQRQIVVASRERHLVPELLFSRCYWRTDHHDTACRLILQGLGWGILPTAMLTENPYLNSQLKVLNFADFTPKFTYFMDLVWSRESQLGQAAHFLINHIQNHRKMHL